MRYHERVACSLGTASDDCQREDKTPFAGVLLFSNYANESSDAMSALWQRTRGPSLSAPPNGVFIPACNLHRCSDCMAPLRPTTDRGGLILRASVAHNTRAVTKNIRTPCVNTHASSSAGRQGVKLGRRHPDGNGVAVEACADAAGYRVLVNRLAGRGGY